ncbi:Basic endochitinase B [Raphanus sativus]|nr:Basic endochitinase B [Raphanus sativus]
MKTYLLLFLISSLLLSFSSGEQCGKQAGEHSAPTVYAAASLDGFFTYDAFITAAKFFPSFGNTGDHATRKKEIAAFFGQTSHETTGGWPSAPDGANTWGYCFKDEIYKSNPYCDSNNFQWPCAPGHFYYGRGPIMLSWNYNYGQCGRDLGLDLLHRPDIASNDPVIAFETAIWFWMTSSGS